MKKINAFLITKISMLSAGVCLLGSLSSIPVYAETALKVPSAIDSSRLIYKRADTTGSAANNNTYLNNASNSTYPGDVAAMTGAAPTSTNSNSANSAGDNSSLVQVYHRPIQAHLQDTGIDLSKTSLANIPTPQTSISDISFIETILIPKTTSNPNDRLDVSMIDDFIKQVIPNVRHYPPNFPNRSQRYNTKEKIKVFTQWIAPYANAPDASYDVLMRAAQLNGMARNLDLGSDYAVNASNYVAKALSRQPNSAEANFLYGMMLSEGGGFKEGRKYLDRAATQGYTEAEQSLAQADLLTDNRSGALSRLRQLQMRLPDDKIIKQQIELVENGDYYIWNIPAPNINIKPQR